MKNEKKGVSKKGVVAGKIKAYLKFEKEINAQIADIDWNNIGAFDTKFNLIAKLNVAYDMLSVAEKNKLHNFTPKVATGKGINDAVSSARYNKKEIQKGVYGRDLIQPLGADGLPNPEFVEHYGVANYTPEHKEYIRDKMGKDKNRENDWRGNKR